LTYLLQRDQGRKRPGVRELSMSTRVEVCSTKKKIYEFECYYFRPEAEGRREVYHPFSLTFRFGMSVRSLSQHRWFGLCVPRCTCDTVRIRSDFTFLILTSSFQTAADWTSPALAGGMSLPPLARCSLFCLRKNCLHLPARSSRANRAGWAKDRWFVLQAHRAGQPLWMDGWTEATCTVTYMAAVAIGG
jgi:hypothetical protein